jgi:hypothetical protein
MAKRKRGKRHNYHFVGGVLKHFDVSEVPSGPYVEGCSFNQGSCEGDLSRYQSPAGYLVLRLCSGHAQRLSVVDEGFEEVAL